MTLALDKLIQRFGKEENRVPAAQDRQKPQVEPKSAIIRERPIVFQGPFLFPIVHSSERQWRPVDNTLFLSIFLGVLRTPPPFFELKNLQGTQTKNTKTHKGNLWQNTN